MHIVKDQTTGEPKAHVLTGLEAEALEVRIVEVLQSGVRMNNNESSLFAGILTRLEEARGEGKGPYISIKQWNWLTDVLDKYEPAYAPVGVVAPAYTQADLFAAIDRVATIKSYLEGAA